MGATKNEKDPAFSTTWVTRGIIVVAIGAAFWLGWQAAIRQAPATHGVNGSTTPANGSSQLRPVHLDLDAGGLTLIPDADIRLKPLPKLDPDDLYRDSLDAGAPDAR